MCNLHAYIKSILSVAFSYTGKLEYWKVLKICKYAPSFLCHRLHNILSTTQPSLVIWRQPWQGMTFSKLILYSQCDHQWWLWWRWWRRCVMWWTVNVKMDAVRHWISLPSYFSYRLLQLFSQSWLILLWTTLHWVYLFLCYFTATIRWNDHV